MVLRDELFGFTRTLSVNLAGAICAFLTIYWLGIRSDYVYGLLQKFASLFTKKKKMDRLNERLEKLNPRLLEFVWKIEDIIDDSKKSENKGVVIIESDSDYNDRLIHYRHTYKYSIHAFYITKKTLDSYYSGNGIGGTWVKLESELNPEKHQDKIRRIFVIDSEINIATQKNDIVDCIQPLLHVCEHMFVRAEDLVSYPQLCSDHGLFYNLLTNGSLDESRSLFTYRMVAEPQLLSKNSRTHYRFSDKEFNSYIINIFESAWMDKKIKHQSNQLQKELGL